MAAAAVAAAATMAAAAAAAATAAVFRLGGGTGKTNWNFSKKTKTKKIRKNLKQINKNQEKYRFWRSYAKTDVTIKFYAKNYP